MADDPVGDAINIGYLLAFAVVAYVAWKIYDSFAGTKADNGQPKCTYADQQAGNCVGTDGTACGAWEYWTATSCYKGTPAAAPAAADAVPDDASFQSGIRGGADLIGSTFTGSDTAPGALAPGLPVGYDPSTGLIN
jgi:hypothetical protein